MQTIGTYISKEYLALRINYCKQQLAMLPKVTVTQRTIRGAIQVAYIMDSRRYLATGKTGKTLKTICERRTELQSNLMKYEGLWNSEYKCAPPAELQPKAIRRIILTADYDSVVMDKNFFDNLKNDANPNHRENKTCFYNGTYYRSAAEAEIARFYDEQQIPFKYEPEIWLKGLIFPVYPDFVIYIKELDLCKIHEHFGMRNSSSYNRSTATKYINYTNAGLLPQVDVIFTYNPENMPFDICSLSIKINSAVYESLRCPEV